LNLVTKRTFIAFFILMIFMIFFLPIADAHLGIAFGSGKGTKDITPYRLAVSWDFGPVWPKQSLWAFNFIWENSVGVWDGPSRPELSPDRPTHLTAFTTGPMFRWQRQQPFPSTCIIPYAELGVGLSWLSKTEIEGRMVSLHFQFEDKGGVGLRFGRHQQFDIGVRAYHYSNCSIKRPNSGVNMGMVNLGLWF